MTDIATALTGGLQDMLKQIHTELKVISCFTSNLRSIAAKVEQVDKNIIESNDVSTWTDEFNKWVTPPKSASDISFLSDTSALNDFVLPAAALPNHSTPGPVITEKINLQNIFSGKSFLPTYSDSSILSSINDCSNEKQSKQPLMTSIAQNTSQQTHASLQIIPTVISPSTQKPQLTKAPRSSNITTQKEKNSSPKPLISSTTNNKKITAPKPLKNTVVPDSFNEIQVVKESVLDPQTKILKNAQINQTVTKSNISINNAKITANKLPKNISDPDSLNKIIVAAEIHSEPITLITKKN